MARPEARNVFSRESSCFGRLYPECLSVENVISTVALIYTTALSPHVSGSRVPDRATLVSYVCIDSCAAASWAWIDYLNAYCSPIFTVISGGNGQPAPSISSRTG